jgi:glycosyltransferase involved in cell wall biosynthesis
MFSIQVLVATMHQENKSHIISLLENMNIESDCLIVNQCDIDGIEQFYYKKHEVTVINSTERGLSRSRNMALKHAKADLVVIADDDVCYNNDYVHIIQTAYEENLEFDILTFMVKDNKKYFPREKKLNSLLIHKIASWEITMKLNNIKSLQFNESFGAGSSCISMGEEIIFLNNCIKSGKKIRFIPQKIAYFPKNSRPSTWFTGFNKKYMLDQGVVYYELSHIFAVPYIIQFAIRKYNLYKGNFGVCKAIYYMLCGIIMKIKLFDHHKFKTR